MAKRSLPIRLLRGFGILIGVFILLIVILGIALRHPQPTVLLPGPEAEALAQSVEKALNADAWQKTGALKWNWGGLNQYLWDRQRSYIRYRHKDIEVLLDLNDKSGLAWKNKNPVMGSEGKALIETAWRSYINDSFWLGAPYKLFDPGTTRFKTEVDGKPALLIKYASGGVTPGDSYLWILGTDSRPIAWRMFVQIIPVPGLETTWEEWNITKTGAVLSTMHRLAGLPLVHVTDLESAAKVTDLEPNGDPFELLVKGENRVR